MERLFAVVEDSKVVNVVVGVEPEVVASDPSRYIEYTDGWTYPDGIDGSAFFPARPDEEAV